MLRRFLVWITLFTVRTFFREILCPTHQWGGKYCNYDPFEVDSQHLVKTRTNAANLGVIFHGNIPARYPLIDEAMTLSGIQRGIVKSSINLAVFQIAVRYDIIA
jgi:hypothetical protein